MIRVAHAPKRKLSSKRRPQSRSPLPRRPSLPLYSRELCRSRPTKKVKVSKHYNIVADPIALVDPKLTLCAYFKAGVCEKGKKCKYSHDLSLEDNRSMAIDLYTDPRQKIGKMPDTIITCREFLDAVEKNLYGFNWTCPNGADNCQYRHMLPMGYVLKRDQGKQDAEDDDEEMTLEEKIEEERALLPSEGLTPVTLESFQKWKADRAAKKQAELEAKIAAEEAKGRRDKSKMTFMSGRALFSINPDLFEDDDDATADDIFAASSGLAEDEESKADNGAAAQGNADEETKEEESKENVQVDNDLFAGEAGDLDEDVDFD